MPAGLPERVLSCASGCVGLSDGLVAGLRRSMVSGAGTGDCAIAVTEATPNKIGNSVDGFIVFLLNETGVRSGKSRDTDTHQSMHLSCLRHLHNDPQYAPQPACNAYYMCFNCGSQLRRRDVSVFFTACSTIDVKIRKFWTGTYATLCPFSWCGTDLRNEPNANASCH